MKNILFFLKTVMICSLSLLFSCFCYAKDSNDIYKELGWKVYPAYTDVDNYGILLQMDRSKLSKRSKLQLNNTLNVYKFPDSKEAKMKFIKEFPKDFRIFLLIFNPSDFGELYYRSDFHLNVLLDLSLQYPQEVAPLLVSLAKDAMSLNGGMGDAPASLQETLTLFIINHYDIFIPYFKKLNLKQQKNAAYFLADMDTILDNPEYNQILELFKKHKEETLYNIFLKEKIKRGKEH